MKNKSRNILNSLLEIEPPKYLKEAVLNKVLLIQERRIKRKRMLFNFALSLSGISFFAAVIYFGNQFISSDFWTIGMLGFTDFFAVANHWQEFGLSLLETLPTFSIIGILLPIFVTMALLRKYAELKISHRLYFKAN